MKIGLIILWKNIVIALVQLIKHSENIMMNLLIIDDNTLLKLSLYNQNKEMIDYDNNAEPDFFSKLIDGNENLLSLNQKELLQ